MPTFCDELESLLKKQNYQGLEKFLSEPDKVGWLGNEPTDRRLLVLCSAAKGSLLAQSANYPNCDQFSQKMVNEVSDKGNKQIDHKGGIIQCDTAFDRFVVTLKPEEKCDVFRWMVQQPEPRTTLAKDMLLLPDLRRYIKQRADLLKQMIGDIDKGIKKLPEALAHSDEAQAKFHKREKMLVKMKTRLTRKLAKAPLPQNETVYRNKFSSGQVSPLLRGWSHETDHEIKSGLTTTKDGYYDQTNSPHSMQLMHHAWQKRSHEWHHLQQYKHENDSKVRPRSKSF